jgi:CelD/BcsL family acetyltransferase involved in cellulose biosynthesis
MLEKCIQWKVAQGRRTGRDDIFKYPWVARLLHQLLAFRGDEFSPAMPVCFAGDRVVAILLGMRSADVFHSWFPTYDFELASCSPGAVLWIETMMAAQTQGIRRIILGKGDEIYKDRLKSGVETVAQGCVDSRLIRGAARRATRVVWRRMRRSIAASPLRRHVQGPARIVHQIRNWVAFR